MLHERVRQVEYALHLGQIQLQISAKSGHFSVQINTLASDQVATTTNDLSQMLPNVLPTFYVAAGSMLRTIDDGFCVGI